MKHLFLVGLSALFLIGCTAESSAPGTPASPAAAATDTSAKFELGKTV